MMSYLRYAYLGVKGSVRKRVHYFIDSSSKESGQFRASLDAPSTTVIPASSYNVGVTYGDSYGTITMVPHSNGGLEFEVPFYVNNLFVFSFSDDLTSPSSNGEMTTQWSKSYTTSLDSFSANDAGTIVEESAGAEDLTFMRFQGAPYFLY
jgi:hypothetical protein